MIVNGLTTEHQFVDFCVIMVREKDVCWEYAEKLDGNKRVLNGGISRLKHHLSRLPSKGVNPCSKVRDDVTDRVRAIIASKEDVKEPTPTVKKQKLVEAKSPGNVPPIKGLPPVEAAQPPPVAKVYPTVIPVAPSSLSNQENAERSIALFFFENKLDFSVARSPSYQQMIDAIGKCGAGFTGPSAEICILQAQTISKFIYNNASILDLMKKFTGGQELIKTGITKSVSNFLSLQSMLKQKPRLKLMFNSPEFSTNTSYANKPQSIGCIAIVEDGEFWRAVEESVAISEPFLKVLREVSGGKPAIGSIYELMTRAKESIRTYYIMDESKCKIFLDIVDRKWRDQLHSPLHAAAAFLNPSVQYNPEIKFLVAIKEDFFKVIEKLLPTPDMRRDITNQIFIFTRANGMFGCSLAMEARDTVAPGMKAITQAQHSGLIVLVRPWMGEPNQLPLRCVQQIIHVLIGDAWEPPDVRTAAYVSESWSTRPRPSPGSGIRITVKPEYRITPPPQLSPLIGEIPRSKFQFDFDLERKILAEAEKGSQDWSKLGLEHLPSKPTESTPSPGPAGDPVVSKYIASGLDREAVILAVANYGDNPTKVREFVSGYNLLREMGFSSNNVAETLVMYENDTDKALAHFLNNSS
ncbi:hypothetical protein Tsubulata_017620 [Turnera subulata]|uniref:UBA domain-containing protein n=1 Tax=Turnera subulata TaxID=218843 RepID=A0A9Q0JQJ3_9ROSI|nr:hypothetical protein Tsubulata_017620 [Turnera subulata]